MRTLEKEVRQGAAGRREYAGQLQLIGDAGHERSEGQSFCPCQKQQAARLGGFFALFRFTYFNYRATMRRVQTEICMVKLLTWKQFNLQLLLLRLNTNIRASDNDK